ncbi:MAG: glycosyltransferase family 4 protein [Acidobacteriia bacterium]|nr:glycosyltransferase family 4 protein [Terriglobia bacterium]
MRGPLRIGVNALYMIPGGVGGTEIYLRGLLTAMAEIDRLNQYFVFTNQETGADLVPKAPNFSAAPQPVRAAFRPARILWEQTGLPLNAARRRLDVMLNPGFTAPILCGCPQVTAFHDLQHKRHPEYFRWFDLPFWEFFLFWSAHVSRLLLADSDATAADLLRYYRLPESKVRVAPLGVDPVFFDLARRRRPERFLLAVSTLHPHKNLDGLLRAFAAFRRQRPEFRLVVCGMHGFFAGPLHGLRDSLGLGDAVDFPGWIPREDLHELYTKAWAFIYPSLFEGFGLPVLEALAASVPAACSAIEPLSSIAGTAALQFDPLDQNAMVEAMLRITGDEPLRQRLSEAGPRRAAHFSWRATAEATLAAMTRASTPV